MCYQVELLTKVNEQSSEMATICMKYDTRERCNSVVISTSSRGSIPGPGVLYFRCKNLASVECVCFTGS